MKKLLTIVFAMSLPMTAAAQITGTAHDLSSVANNARATSDSDRICVFCHVPHNARTDINAIWNQSAPATSVYDWGTLGTTVGGTTLQTTIGSGSLKCFSCHDGSVDMGALANGANYTVTGNDITSGSISNSSFVVDQSSMAGNHPVSVRYPNQTSSNVYNSGATGAMVDPGTYNTIAVATSKGVVFSGTAATSYGVECSSCHDPHGTTFSYYLRATTLQSAICMACHIK